MPLPLGSISRDRRVAPRIGYVDLLRHGSAYFRSPIFFLERIARQQRDIVFFQAFNKSIVFLNHPDYIRQVLQTRVDNYARGQAIDDLAYLLGNGLFRSSGDLWRRQSALMQTAFKRNPVEAAAGFVSSAIEDIVRRWSLVAERGEAVNIIPDMRRLAFDSLYRTMLSEDHSVDFEGIDQALTVIMDDTAANNYALRALWRTALVFAGRPLRLPAEVRKALAYLDAQAYALIQDCRQKKRAGLLMTLLLEAADQGVIDDRQIRDELMNVFFAGYETTAVALIWALHLLATHETAANRLQEELDTVLGARAPSVDDLPALGYTRMVLSETLRLYPSAWGFVRLAVEEDEIEGFTIPRGTIVVMCPYLLHRNPDFWEDPEVFRPERFESGQSTEAIRSCYIPFGDGPHVCIGKHFALMLGRLALARLAQVFRLVPASDEPVSFVTRITIQPRYPLKMRPVRRSTGSDASANEPLFT